MKYIKPNLEHEWMEALRYREFEKMGKDGWMDIASKNYEIKPYSEIKNVLGNVDLDYVSLEDNKKKRFESSFEKGKVEIPIAVKFSENDYDLLGGNTRLAGLISKEVDPKIYVVDLSKKEKEVDEKSNPYDDDNDKDDIFPTGSSDWRKKKEVGEMDAGSSGSFEGPLFGITKKKLQEEILGTGEFDVPAFGKTPKGRKNPLKLGGTDTIYKNRAVKDKKWPRFGGPKAVYVKVKDKCKKFPYCNQGDTGALEFIHEDKDLMNAIKETAQKYGIPYSDMENIVLNEINKIFI